MKKIAFILFLVHFFASGQISSIPSPNSLSQASFNGGVNESSGILTKNIPLLNYSVGKLNVPISVNYSGNAVKVVQLPSWTGVNWNLNAGGLVTRTVNDYPDEKATQRIFFDDILALGTNFENVAYSYVELDNDTKDYRVDLFSFSFAGYSGSFYIDPVDPTKAVLTDKSSELKISFNVAGGSMNATGDNTIIITTPEGVSYYFGGVNASEYSSSLVEIKKKGVISGNPTSGYYDNNEVTQSVSALAATSFYLFKIENIFGDQILFDYLNDGTKTYTLYERQELPKADFSNFVNEGCWDLEEFEDLRSSVFKVSIHSSRKISKIYSPASNFEVRFTSSNLFLPSYGTVPSPQYDDRKLDMIQLFDSQLNENLKNISFNYLLPNGTNSYRFFLDSIKVNNTNSPTADECEKYRFTYNSPENLPDRFSYQTDLLGFYNGEANTTLLSQYQNIIFDETFQNLAVRESNFEFASKGVLNKIYYPTGGYQEIEYENPQLAVISDVRKSLRIYRNQSEYIPTSKTSHILNIGGEIGQDPGDPVLSNPITQTLNVQVNASVIPNGAYHHHRVYVTVENLTAGGTQSDYMDFFTGTYNYSQVFSFTLLKDNNYRVTLKFDNLNPSAQDATVEVNALAYYKSHEFYSTLGLRVKSVKAFDEINQMKDYKRFYYKKLENVSSPNDESAVITFKASQQIGYETYCCSENNASNSFSVVRLTANPLSYYLSGSDNQISYRYVTTSFGGDYFENGGVEKSFNIIEPTDTKMYLYGPFVVENEGMDFGSNNLSNETQYSGQLVGERVFRKNGFNNYTVQSETKYNYVTVIEDEIKSFIAKKTSSLTNGSCILPQNEFVDHPLIGYYSNYSYSNKLVSVETKVMKEDQTSSGGTIATLTEYEYNSLNGLVTKVSSNDSKGNTQITEFKYPTTADIASMMSYGFDASYITAYNELKNKNIVSLPIETVNKYQYQNGPLKTVSKSATLFRIENGFVIPEKTLTAKANGNYEGNVENSLFDSNGNLLEITQENVFKKSYIYGYNNQLVIAELNNCAYNSIPTATINNLKNLSDNVVDDVSMDTFKTALNQLRDNFQDAIVTIFVYDKYKMLRETIDARGQSIYQDYDDCKRLRMIRDNELNVIKEYQYNLNQN